MPINFDDVNYLKKTKEFVIDPQDDSKEGKKNVINNIRKGK